MSLFGENEENLFLESFRRKSNLIESNKKYIIKENVGKKTKNTYILFCYCLTLIPHKECLLVNLNGLWWNRIGDYL